MAVRGGARATLRERMIRARGVLYVLTWNPFMKNKTGWGACTPAQDELGHAGSVIVSGSDWAPPVVCVKVVLHVENSQGPGFE